MSKLSSIEIRRTLEDMVLQLQNYLNTNNAAMICLTDAIDDIADILEVQEKGE